MTRNQAIFKQLKKQAQSMFWRYEAEFASKSEAPASPAAVSAYKASLFEFLQYAAEQFHLKKLTQIRKKHVTAYISYLKSRNHQDYTVSKRVYAICFWLGMEERAERFPSFESFCFEYPVNIKITEKTPTIA